jgi:hypothetical protein
MKQRCRDLAMRFRSRFQATDRVAEARHPTVRTSPRPHVRSTVLPFFRRNLSSGKNKVVRERNLFVVKTLALVSSSFKTAEQQYVS